MGQPARDISPDSLSGVIGQTQSHLSEVENRLNNLLNRILIVEDDKTTGRPLPVATGSLAKATEITGVASSASAMRNTASRLVDLVGQLEQVI